jgi:SP family sugar:H+ symporter-like MFS transporter
MTDLRDQQPDVAEGSALPVGRTILVTSVAALGGFLFGYDTAVINGAVDALTKAYRLGPLMSGFAVSVVLLGCALGAWVAGSLANRFGRVRVMLIAASLFFVSAFGSGFSFTQWDFSM